MSSLGNILVVEDEESLRHSLTRILRHAGYEVTGAADGLEALRRLDTSTFDLTYLDLRLPGMDGMQLLREIRTRFPQLPVILFTAHGSLQTALEALRLGANDYLLKPIDPEVLVSRTRTVIQEHVAERRRSELREQIENLQIELRRLDEQYPQVATPSEVTAPKQAPEERFVKHGRLILDLQAQRATFGESVLSLPPATFDYLVTLARHAPDVVDYQTLVAESQGYQVDALEARQLAKWHIHLVRQSMESDPKEPQHIHNVRGVGYRLLVD